MVKIPTLTNQTTLDASPEPMLNPVANRTGEIMGKGIQQVGTVTVSYTHLTLPTILLV